MAQICIWDAQGRRICYNNHAKEAPSLTAEPPASAVGPIERTRWEIVYYPLVGDPEYVDGGPLLRDMTNMEKLQLLIDKGVKKDPYAGIFAQFSGVTVASGVQLKFMVAPRP